MDIKFIFGMVNKMFSLWRQKRVFSTEDPPTPDRVLLPVPDEEVRTVVVHSARPPREKRRVRFTLPDGTQVPTRDKTRSLEFPEQEYVFDKLVDVWEAVDGSSRVYRVRWLGYNPNGDTWESEDNLPKHFIRRYWKSKGITTKPGNRD
jgi:Chromo (CHRromatin Organisation MOdifier) domain